MCVKNGRVRICPECTKEIYVTPSREALGRGIYCSKKCMAIGFTKEVGKNHRSYKGDDHTFISTSTRKKGQKQIVRRYSRDTNGKLRLEHRIIMELHLGRKLKREEIIHHINCDPLDNRIENLLICNSHIHTKIHQRMGEMYAKLVGIEHCMTLIEEILNEP